MPIRMFLVLVKEDSVTNPRKSQYNFERNFSTKIVPPKPPKPPPDGPDVPGLLDDFEAMRHEVRQLQQELDELKDNVHQDLTELRGGPRAEGRQYTESVTESIAESIASNRSEADTEVRVLKLQYNLIIV